MKKREIAICPKCKGHYIFYDSSLITGAPSWICKDCGFHALGYPPVAVKARKKSSYI